MADKHALQSTTYSTGDNLATFDGRKLDLVYRKGKGDLPSVDWMASYDALRKTDPRAAQFMYNNVLTEKQRKEIFSIEEKVEDYGPHDDYTRVEMIAKTREHQLKTMWSDTHGKDAFFDGERINLVWGDEHHKFPYDTSYRLGASVDWVATYDAMAKDKQANPDATAFIYEFMLTPKEREQVVVKNALKLRKRGKTVLTVLKGLRNAGILKKEGMAKAVASNRKKDPRA